IVLGILIFVHEMGHYLVARWCGVRIETFSIGFGKEIFGWTDKQGTRWKVALIPLGGYVKMFGEKDGANPGDHAESQTTNLTDEEKKVSFAYKTLPQRAAIVAAGPLINFAFAIVIFAGLFMFIGKPVQSDFMVDGIGDVVEGSAADLAGFEKGDVILAGNGVEINEFRDLVSIVQESKGAPVSFTISRNGLNKELVAQAQETVIGEQDGKEIKAYRLGIMGVSAKMVSLGIVGSIVEATTYTWDITVMTFQEIGRLFVGQGDVDNLGGPIKIAQMSSEVGDLGGLAIINFIALLSINLGLLNLLPIPMLDGGHLLFYAIEGVLRRPISEKIQEISLRFGLAFLLTLMVFVMGNDILNITL
ncbi:RIP metalloprotease RseP, partial [Curvivirga aplysinae]|uniref:RIP metalloprotease RseP n=1 Tax=Curvivirga aplysinae TaxID=2529852 RepID=UPI0012BD178E